MDLLSAVAGTVFTVLLALFSPNRTPERRVTVVKLRFRGARVCPGYSRSVDTGFRPRSV